MKASILKTSAIAIGISLSLLLIPFMAMQFTNEVAWTISDFVVMGLLLALVGFGINAAWRFGKKNSARILYAAAIVFLFLIIWAELAVGIFNTPFAGS